MEAHRYTVLIALALIGVSVAAYASSTIDIAVLRETAVISETGEVLLAPGKDLVISPPPMLPAPGYTYMKSMITVAGEVSDIDVVAIPNSRATASVGDDEIVVVAYGAKVKLVNTGTSDAEIRLVIRHVYVRERYIDLSKLGEVALTVPPGDIPTNTQHTYELFIAPESSYFITGVNSSEGIRVEPKYLVINSSKAKPGTYVVRLGEGFSLPRVAVVRSMDYSQEVLKPKQTLVVTPDILNAPDGWNVLGYIVVVIGGSISIGGGERGDIEIRGLLVDTQSSELTRTVIRAVSGLIPPIWHVDLYRRIALVYGPRLEVENGMRMPVTVMYIPLLYREARYSVTGRGIEIGVTFDDIGGVWTSVWVFAPLRATVKRVTGLDAEPIETGFVGNMAYIVVQRGGDARPGNYVVELDWRPVIIEVVDGQGAPLDAEVRIGGEVVKAVNGRVELDITRPVNVSIIYRGVEVAELSLDNLDIAKIRIAVSVYKVSIKVNGVLGPVSGAEVILVGEDGNITAVTDENGVAAFGYVPEGNYTLIVKYGDSELYRGTITIDKNGEERVDTDFVVGVLGKPITFIEVVGASLVMTSLYFIPRLIKHRRGEEVEVEEL